MQVLNDFYLLNPLVVVTVLLFLYQNKTNNPISSNSHPTVTENIAIHCIKRGGYKTNGNII